MTHILLLFISALLALNSLIPGSAGTELPLSDVRLPVVSGQFYPSDPGKLELAIRQYLKESITVSMQDPVAVLVPHAGYIYSGPTSADAYRQIMDRNYDVFIILGVNHTTGGFRGVSVADYASFRTPLGDVPVDQTVSAALMEECSDCVLSREVHIREHSIEVQLPFLQVLFPEAKIVPVIIHPPDLDVCRRFGETLARVLKNRKALIIISSDLSHYPTSMDAVEADRKTLKVIAGLDPVKIAAGMRDLDIPNLDTRACGEAAILSGVTAAGILGAKRAVVAGYANSGDTTLGEQNRTVGYSAVVFTSGNAPNDLHTLNRENPPESATPLKDPEKKWLLSFARETIHQYLTTETLPLARNLPARLRFMQGAFVTYKKGDQLRGCIGTMLAENELGSTVGKMSLYAALEDPRYPPVTLEELDNLEIEISVLSPLRPIDDPKRIVIGRDGVVLIKEDASAVFLPQVAPEQNWNREEMLENLCRKAGLPKDCWENDASLQVFQADVFSE